MFITFGWTPGDIWVVEHDNFDQAVEAYADYCDRTGAVFQQPSRMDSEEKRGVVHLRNVDGLLARHSVK